MGGTHRPPHPSLGVIHSLKRRTMLKHRAARQGRRCDNRAKTTVGSQGETCSAFHDPVSSMPLPKPFWLPLGQKLDPWVLPPSPSGSTLGRPPFSHGNLTPCPEGPHTNSFFLLKYSCLSTLSGHILFLIHTLLKYHFPRKPCGTPSPKQVQVPCYVLKLVSFLNTCNTERIVTLQ